MAAAPQRTRRRHCFRSGLVRGRRLARRRRRRRAASGRGKHGPIVPSRRRSYSVSEPRAVFAVVSASPSGHLLTGPPQPFFPRRFVGDNSLRQWRWPPNRRGNPFIFSSFQPQTFPKMAVCKKKKNTGRR